MIDPVRILDGRVRLYVADCRDALASMAVDSVDSVVTDPPYHFASIVKRFGGDGAAPAKSNGATGVYERSSRGFMGKVWDGGDIAFRPETWAAVLRVLKPGGHMVAFGAPKNYHRLACAIEDAGFEIRDSLMWLFGTGFPKSHNLDGEWQGWGTALKPAHEPILHCTKPVTVRQHFAMIVEELTIQLAEILPWSDCNVFDAPQNLSAIQAKWHEEGSSVLDGARMRSLASIGIAPSAALSSTLPALVSLDLTRTRDCSALSHVRPHGSEVAAADQTTQHGEAGDTLTRIMDMSTSVVTGDTLQNIVLSWRRISEDLWRGASKFTIETAIRLTIALKTLNYSLPPNITDDTGRLRPNATPIILARKPLVGTVAANVKALGTGAINVDGCRVGSEGGGTHCGNRDAAGRCLGHPDRRGTAFGVTYHGPEADGPLGRWPANVLHDGSDEVLAGFPDSGSAARFFASFPFLPTREGAYDGTWPDLSPPLESAPIAGPSSFPQRQAVASALVHAANLALPEGLFCTSASLEPSTIATGSELKRLSESVTESIQSIGPRFWLASGLPKLSLTLSHANVAVDREPTGITTITASHWKSDGSAAPVTFSITLPNSALGAKDSRSGYRFKYAAKASKAERAGSKHPTVKPIALMRWLCRLITPPGGVILDPFAGSGTTGQAAMDEEFSAILIEREAEYAADIERRINDWRGEEGRALARGRRSVKAASDGLPLFDEAEPQPEPSAAPALRPGSSAA